MSGTGTDPGDLTDSQKLDQLLRQVAGLTTQLTAVNTRLDGHATRLARTEQWRAEQGPLPPPQRPTGSGDTRHRPKLNFPHFDGESDPLPWINKCESYFRGMCTLEEEKVWMASLHLDGVASEWFYALDRDNAGLTWPGFVDFLNLGFGPPIRANPLAELKDLKRTGTVEEYQW